MEDVSYDSLHPLLRESLEGAEAYPVKRDPRVLIEHILESIELIEEYLRGVSKD